MTEEENQWCHCVTNDGAIEKAHAVLQFAVAQFYGRDKCCVGSMADIMALASHMACGVAMKVASINMEKEGCPLCCLA